MTVTITHVYDYYETAQAVLTDLEKAGFSHDDISVVGRHGHGETTVSDEADAAATGATLGGVAGAGVGLLAALGVIAIPGIGPLVAAGVLATTLAGAATGALAGGLVGALTEYGVSHEDAPVYAENLRRGGTLVSIRVDEGKSTEADEIMKRHGPVDIRQRGQAYRNEGWTDYDPKAAPYEQSEMEQERSRYGSTNTIVTPRT